MTFGARAISDSGREALKNYKYQSTLKGTIDKVIMTPFWEFVVSFVPLSVHPNVLTFVGSTQVLLCCCLFQFYCTDLETCLPSWLYYSLAASQFIYQTLDAIDGKQARRTQSSSPLGQLFDHGNDALIMAPVLTCGFATAQYGQTWEFLLMTMMGLLVFFMINWRARHEGLMHFGFFSVTESQFLSIFLLLTAGFFGCDLWSLPIFGIKAKHYLVAFLVVLGCYTSVNDFLSVQEYYANHREKRGQGRFYEISHLLLFFVGAGSWNLVNIVKTHPWTYFWINGLIFCGMIHRLIVSDVTHQKSAKYYNLLNPLLFMFVGSLYEYYFGLPLPLLFGISMNSSFVVYGILVYVVVFWLNYVFKVINEICDTLNIRLFVLTPKAE